MFRRTIPETQRAWARTCLLWTILIGSAVGCGTTQENRIHLAVASMDSTNSVLKFYRLTIHAHSSNSKATLQTGFYDANAVRDLFGEVKQPTSTSAGPPATKPGSIGSYQFRFDDQTGAWSLVPPDELFTIMFGVNAQAIAAEIKTYASSDEAGLEFGKLLAATAGKDTALEAISAEQLSQDQRTKASTLASEVKKKKEDLDKLTNPAPEDVEKLLLDCAQSAARQLGASTAFRTDNSTNGFTDAQNLYQLLQGTPK